MISSVTTPLSPGADLPPPVEDAAGAAPGRSARPRAAAVTLLPGLGVGSAPASTAKAPRARPSAAGYATSVARAVTAAASSPRAAPKASTAKSSSSAAKRSGPLAFLDDAKLSLEDKLLRLLAYLNDKWNKDLDRKMKELKTVGGDGSAAGSGASSASAKKSSGVTGMLGGLVSMAKDVMPGLGLGLDLLSTPPVRSALSGVAGPGLAALATAMGMPELAPLALKYGPEIVDAAASVAKGAGASSPPAAPKASSSSASSGAGSIGSDRDAQLKLMEIQRIMDQQKEMFSLTSNLLRTGHDTRMAVIQNLR